MRLVDVKRCIKITENMMITEFLRKEEVKNNPFNTFISKWN